MLSVFYFSPRSVQLVARINPSWNVIYLFRALAISCNKLHATIYDFLVACILMHDGTTHGRYLTLSDIHNFVQQVARYDLWFPYSVHLDVRPNYARNIIYLFRALTISCNKLHATILSHAQNEIKCGDFCECFFNQRIINRQARYSFRATRCTLRFN